jgi:hypothetical protein
MTTLTRTTSTFKTPSSQKDAIALLRADHERLRGLFADFEATHLDTDKRALVVDICAALRVHACIDEEVFYPAIDAVLGAPRPTGSPALAQPEVFRLLDQLEAGDADWSSINRWVGQLASHVRLHVRQENSDVFPRIRAADMDLVRIASHMTAKRVALLGRKA